MGTNRTEERKDKAASSPAATGLEQVREILFGAHFREMERRIAQLEARHDGTVDELRKEMARRFDALESHVRRESEALAARLAAEHTAQLDALKGVSHEGRETLHAQESRLARLEESSSTAQREMRQAVLDQAKEFLDEIRRSRDDTRTLIAREIATLTNALAAGDATPIDVAPVAGMSPHDRH